MLDAEFLNGLLANEEVPVDAKIQQIIAEHEADTRGLLAKRDELLGSEKKLKEKISAYENEKAETAKHLAEVEEALQKASSEDNRKYYETQLADAQGKFDSQIAELTEQRDYYLTMHLNSLRDKAIEEGCKTLNFVPGLEDGFVARVLALNDFEPKDIDGHLKFLNAENHTIEEAINAFALTQEGKAYISNPSTGGGARGSSTPAFGTRGSKNPCKAGQENLTEQMRLYKEDRATYDRLKAEAGL